MTPNSRVLVLMLPAHPLLWQIWRRRGLPSVVACLELFIWTPGICHLCPSNPGHRVWSPTFESSCPPCANRLRSRGSHHPS